MAGGQKGGGEEEEVLGACPPGECNIFNTPLVGSIWRTRKSRKVDALSPHWWSFARGAA